MAGTYITETDITDTIAKRFIEARDLRVDTWLERANAEIEALAISKDVLVSQIITDPLHPMIADYGRCQFCASCFLDSIGTNNVDTAADEKYRVKYEIYANRIISLQASITPEMYVWAQEHLTAAATSGGRVVWRG